MKKNIILGISLLILAIILIIISNNGKYIEGRVVDITYNSNVMVLINDEPYVVSFKNVDLSSINLNDVVKIKTDGVVRESYPTQMTGYSIKKIKNESIMIKDKYIPSDPDNVNTIIFNSTYYEENPSYKNRFKTKVLRDKSEFNSFLTERSIKIPNNVDNLFKNNIAVVSYTNMTSSGVIDFNGLYEDKSNMYIYLKLTTEEITTTDIVTRGVISFIDKEYENKTFETLTKYIIENN